MFGDDEWQAARGTGRVEHPWSFFGAAELRRLDDLYRESPERQLSNPNNSNYTFGVDGVQLFNFKDHSAWVLVIRCGARCCCAMSTQRAVSMRPQSTSFPGDTTGCSILHHCPASTTPPLNSLLLAAIQTTFAL